MKTRHVRARVSPAQTRRRQFAGLFEALESRRLMAVDFAVANPVVSLTSASTTPQAPYLTVDVQNLGTPVASVHLDVYISPTASPADPNVVIVKSIDIPSAEIGGSVTIGGLTIPNTLGATWFPIVIASTSSPADGSDSDTSNNVATGASFTTPASRTVAVTAINSPAPNPAEAGQRIDFTFTADVAGHFPTDAITTRFYLSADNTIDNGDFFVDGGSVFVLTGPSDTPQPASFPAHFNVPLTLPAGTYHLAMTVDGGTVATAFVGSFTLDVVAPDPGVGTPTLTALIPYGPQLYAGAPARISAHLINGSADLAGVRPTMKFYLSEDNVLDGSDLLVYTDATGGVLAANADFAVTGDFTLPTLTAAKTYYPIVVIQTAGQANGDSSNDVSVGAPIAVTPKRLVITSIDTPATVDFSDAFDITVHALATGFVAGEPPIPFSLDLPDGGAVAGFLQPQDIAGTGTPTSMDFTLSYAHVSPIPLGDYTVSPNLTSPFGITAVVLDPGFSAQALHVVSTSALLRLTPPQLDAVFYHPGDDATISFTVTNDGQQTSGTVNVPVVLHGTAGDVTLDPIVIDPLAVGASRVVSVTRTIPSASATGAYSIDLASSGRTYIGNGGFVQSAELPFVVIDAQTPLPLVDLSMAALSAPAKLTAGSALRVTATPAVVGSVAPPTFSASIFLSKNDVVGDSDDVLLGTVPFTGLALGSTASILKALAVPGNTVPGDYHVLALVDPSNQVSEVGETNNTFDGGIITILPAPVTGNLKAPAKATTAAAPTLALKLANPTGKTLNRKYKVSYYFSSDPVFSPDDVPFSKQTINLSLAKKKSTTVTFAPNLGAKASAGPVYLIAVADSTAKNVAHHFEMSSKVVNVKAPSYTAVVRKVTAVPGKPNSATVTVRLKNTGTAPSLATAPVNVRVLADSPVENTVLATLKKVQNLNPKKFVDLTFTVNRPPTTAFHATVA